MLLLAVVAAECGVVGLLLLLQALLRCLLDAGGPTDVGVMAAAVLLVLTLVFVVVVLVLVVVDDVVDWYRSRQYVEQNSRCLAAEPMCLSHCTQAARAGEWPLPAGDRPLCACLNASRHIFVQNSFVSCTYLICVCSSSHQSQMLGALGLSAAAAAFDDVGFFPGRTVLPLPFDVAVAVLAEVWVVDVVLMVLAVAAGAGAQLLAEVVVAVVLLVVDVG